MKKINSSKYKMVIAKNIFAKHSSSQSSGNSLKTQGIRSSNFIYGELIFDHKQKKLRIIKILRKILQNLILFHFNLIKFQLNKSFINLSIIYGVLKFIFYFLTIRL